MTDSEAEKRTTNETSAERLRAAAAQQRVVHNLVHLVIDNDGAHQPPGPPGGPPGGGGQPKDDIPPFASEDAMAAVLVQQRLRGDWHFVTTERTDLGWYRFADGCWRVDDLVGLKHHARLICRQTAAKMEAMVDNSGKHLYGAATIRKIASEGSAAAVARAARDDPRAVRPFRLFDADPWILNTPDCMIDLKTGQRLPQDKTRLCMRMAGASPSGDCPTWRRCLNEWTGGDRDYQDFLQRLVGYSLIGDVMVEIFLFIYGRSNTGKSKFVETLRLLHGTYGCTAPMETFVVPKGDRGHPTDLAGFAGRRLVTSAETEEGRRWDQQRIKDLTGERHVSARFMRGDFFEYPPQFLLVFHGNHKPRLSNADDAMRRRMRLAPFEHRPAVIDIHLLEKLRAELSGIMVWAIEGCLLWQAHGLAEPAIVRDTTEDYFNAENTLGLWIDERCQVVAGAQETSRQLYQDYKVFVQARNEFVFSERLFCERLIRVDGIGRPANRSGTLDSGRRGFVGIRLRPDRDPTPLGL